MKLGIKSSIDMKTSFVYEKNGGELIVGDGSYINPDAYIRADGAKVIVGKNCRISQRVCMVTYYGAYFAEGYREKKNGAIIIGDGVWIGVGAMIRGNVKIGDYAIVGMGAVVCRDVKPYHVVVGNPAVDKGLRKDHEIIKKVGLK